MNKLTKSTDYYNSLLQKEKKYRLSSQKNLDIPSAKPKKSSNQKNNYLPIINNRQYFQNINQLNKNYNLNKINSLVYSTKLTESNPEQYKIKLKAKNANRIVNHPYNKKDLLKNRKGLGQINPIFGSGPRRKDNRRIGGGMRACDIPSEPEVTEPCPYCGRCFNLVSLAKHSAVCLRVFQSKRIAFDSSSQRVIDDEHRALMHLSTFSTKNYNRRRNEIPKWKLQSLEFRKFCKPIKKVLRTSKYKNNSVDNNKARNIINGNKKIFLKSNNYNNVNVLANNYNKGISKSNNNNYNNYNNYGVKKKNAFKPKVMGFMSSAPRKFITRREDYYKNLF